MIAFSSQLQQAYMPKRYIVIFGMYAFETMGIPCAPQLKRRNGWLKSLVSSPNLPIEKSEIHLSELQWKIYQEYADSKYQEIDIIGTYNHLRE